MGEKRHIIISQQYVDTQGRGKIIRREGEESRGPEQREWREWASLGTLRPCS